MCCYCGTYSFKKHRNAEGKQNVLGPFEAGFFTLDEVSFHRSLATLHSPVHLLIPALHFILYACKNLYSTYHAEIRVHDYVSYLNDLGNSSNTGFKGIVVVSMS